MRHILKTGSVKIVDFGSHIRDHGFVSPGAAVALKKCCIVNGRMAKRARDLKKT